MHRELKNRTDGELVACFAEARDQRAFTELVRRHGPMVMATATRILGNRQDAEDATQAAFLAFAKAARRLRNGAAVGGWLHHAAIRCGKSVGKEAGRWNRNIGVRKEQVKRMSQLTMSASMTIDDGFMQILDAEISRLPAKLRSVVVACGLEDRTRKEAAVALGLPVQTVTTRMTAARKLLASRLARRGVAVPLTALIAATASATKATVVSESLCRKIVQNACSFAAGTPAAVSGLSPVVTNTARDVTAAMTKPVLLLAILLVSVVAIVVGTVRGRIVSPAVIDASFVGDDSSDASPDGDVSVNWSGSPLTWRPQFGAQLSVQEESLVLRASNVRVPTSYAYRPYFSNCSIRSQMRLEIGTAVGIGVRYTPFGGMSNGYAAILSDQVARLYICAGPNSGEAEAVLLSEATTDLSVTQEDIVLQLDAIGSEISVYAWRPDESAPTKPLIRVTDSTVPCGIAVTVFGVGAAYPQPGPFEAAVRYVRIAD